ncbi:MAG: C25 family cysteine peptidase [Planctomycetota bacterium]
MALTATIVSGGSSNYLIITAEAYDGCAALNEFIAAKTAMDYEVSTYVVAPGTSNSAIKSYILDLWGTADSPKYILLVGDTSGTSATSTTIPHFTGGGSKHCVTDLPYACMDAGDDWYPDLCVGRFSVTSTSMLQDVVDKTLFVEAGNFPDPDYVKRAAFLANPSTYGMAEPTQDWIIENLLEPNEYEGVRLYSRDGATTQDVTNAVNNGCLWVGYYGHSSSTGWWDPSFNQGNVSALSNQGLYGVAWSFSCNVGKYSLGECFGETWHRAPDKGAAAVIFPSDYIYWGSVSAWEPSTTLEQAFFRAFFEKHIWQVGPAWQSGLNTFLIESPSSLDVKRNFFELYNLMGDPSLLLPRYELGPIPTAYVISPDGGEVWTVGEEYNIQWNANDDVGVTGIDILLSTDGGATFPHEIATDLADTGTYLWEVPAFNSNECRVKVIAYDGDGNSGEDVSDDNFTITPYGPVLIYDFPMNSNPGWTTDGTWAFGDPTGGGGEYGGPDPNTGHTGSYVYGYNLYGDYENSMPERHLTSTALDCSDASAVTLTFWRWLGVEQPSYDHAYVRVSNNGSTWTTVWSNSGTIEDSSWSLQEFDISSVADGQATVYLRWTMGTTDGSWRYCGWNIDDVQIIGIPSAVTGACCVGATCTIETADYCATLGGIYLGDDTGCLPNPCVAACCHGYFCYDVDPNNLGDPHNEAQCLADGGQYYAGVSCADELCDCGGNDYRGDSNCLGDGVDAYDIDHFIQAVSDPAIWIAGHANNFYCANDINCDGEVNSYDIDWFIACVGQGYCDACP